MSFSSPLVTALVRALIPSWSFFSHMGDTPLLRFRRVDGKGEAKDWQVHPSFRRKSFKGRSWLDLVYNPAGNARLWERALVGRALEELATLGDVNFVHSKIYTALCELAASGLPVEYPRLQFQIWIEPRDGTEEPAYLSEIINPQDFLGSRRSLP